MSHSVEQTVRCPCGEEFEALLWSSVNTQQDPELREEILAGQLNVAKCVMCSRMVYAERFLLFHDPSLELMVFVYPKSYESEKEKWARKTAVDFKAAQEPLSAAERLAYPPVTAFGLDQLVLLLNDEQEKLDEGEILESLSKSIAVEVRRLKPALARARGVPARLPLARGAGSPDERLRRGLSTLLGANDRLAVYARVLSDVKAGKLNLAGVLDAG